MAGGDRSVDWMIDVAKEVFAELEVKNAEVGVIRAELDPKVAIEEFRQGALRPTGEGHHSWTSPRLVVFVPGIVG
jgi:hypothetical protein